MNDQINRKILRQRARALRNKSTDAENHLWKFLRCRFLSRYRFRRQVPIGNYIADFVCAYKRIIIELDGSQHVERQNYDNIRTEFLESLGYKVLRFWNHDVLTETESVLDVILNELNAC